MATRSLLILVGYSGAVGTHPTGMLSCLFYSQQQQPRSGHGSDLINWGETTDDEARLLEEKRREEQFTQLQVPSPSSWGGRVEPGRGTTRHGSWRRSGAVRSTTGTVSFTLRVGEGGRGAVGTPGGEAAGGADCSAPGTID